MIDTVQKLEECSSTCTKCLDDKLTGADGKRHIVLCGGTGCLSSNSMDIKEKFEKVLEDHKVHGISIHDKDSCPGCGKFLMIILLPAELFSVCGLEITQLFPSDHTLIEGESEYRTFTVYTFHIERRAHEFQKALGYVHSQARALYIAVPGLFDTVEFLEQS